MSKYLIGVCFIILISGLKCSKEDTWSGEGENEMETLKEIANYSLNISEPSGIVYNSSNNLFHVVSDNTSEIFVVDSSGHVVRTIPTQSTDLEGITLSKTCDTIFVVEESEGLVTAYLTSGQKVSSFAVNVASDMEHGLEGITRNTLNHRLILLNEKQPCMLLEFDSSNEIRRKEINYSSDLSDVFYDEQTNFYWLLSDESKKVFKLSDSWDLIGEWAVKIDQGEGITIAKDRIYIVSDAENKLYVYKKPN
ncbi:MAG: SdiA-regulated domain-containing protein [Ignavibacteriaceae bacterium]|nr:SdiA-regulated domain-containing protein [Ignavibacteriaceae bacterium]